MALILCLESSTEVCSVALAQNGTLSDLEENQEGLNHSELLTAYVEMILKRNKIKASDLDAVAVSKGPGSYTGLRIGVSAAKGICYAAGKPLIAVSTIEAMASYLIRKNNDFGIPLQDDTLICPMIDARRMEVYNAIYDQSGKCILPIAATIIKEGSFGNLLETHTIVFFGNGSDKCKKILTNRNAVFKGPVKASARFMTELAEQRYVDKKFEDVAYFEPFYLKDFIATTPKRKIL